MRHPAVMTVAVLGVFSAPATAADGGIFDLGKERAARIVVTTGPECPDIEPDAPPMVRALRGVLLDARGKDVQALRDCVPRNPFIGDPTGGQRLFTAHVMGTSRKSGGPAAVRHVAILRTPEGIFLAQDVGEDGSPLGPSAARAELMRDAFAALSRAWPAYRGAFDDPPNAAAQGVVFEVEQPLVASSFVMDKPTLGERFIAGSPTNIDGTRRDLPKEKLWARLPRGYTPRRPAGLLVWVDAGRDGRPPDVFAQALDEYGIICIGAADSGNGRPVADRYQLALDAVATAERRWHIDPRRVYVSGISGGGRVSTMLAACFPDVFTGCVPIVGVSCYRPVPNGIGQAWPAGYAKPRGELLTLFKKHRMAPITGRQDANFQEIENATRLMSRDGVAVRLFEQPGMGHEMPQPGGFKEALAWVDEPWRTAHDAETEEAKKAWGEYVMKFGERPPDSVPARRMLTRVMEAGPWTDEAWKAWGLTGKSVAPPAVAPGPSP